MQALSTLTTLLILSTSIVAHCVPCNKEMAPGSLCTAALAELRPTQFSMGRREVDVKVANLRAKSAVDLKAYVGGHPVDTVLGPNGEMYIVDGHHFALAAMDIALTEVQVRILHNYTHLKLQEFWERMASRHWVYLFHLGQGPLPTSELPRQLNQMKDDPFRSLASAVRRNEGFKKSSDHFSEFRWADFFRQMINIGSTDEDFHRALATAYALARGPFARDLPGYLGWDKSCNGALTTLKQIP